MRSFTIEPPPRPESSASRAPDGGGEGGVHGPEQAAASRVGSQVPPESLELLQQRLPKLKGLKVNATAEVEPRL